MDAVLTEATSAPAPPVGASEPRLAGWIQVALAAVIVTGLSWRLLRYFAGFPIWGDEAMLLLNILDRDYAGLTRHLDYSQVAPLLFLWLERTALIVFGTSEWSVRLFPTLAGLFALLIFWRMARASFTPTTAGLAVGILAMSYYPIRHACEVKPYAFDLFFGVLFAWLTLEYLRTHAAGNVRWLSALVLMTPFAVFSSYPSAFVGGAVSLVLLPTMRSATQTQRGLYVVYNVFLVGSFLVHYGMIGHHQIDAAEAQRTREFLHDYWKDAFPPDSAVQWPMWLVQVFTGNMLAYPIGAAHGGSTITFVLVVIGSIALWQSRQRSLLALCWLPMALNLVAAIIGKYPFGGSARITQHLAPFICILMAHGCTVLLDYVRPPVWRARVHLLFCMLLLVCGVVGILRDLKQPYKTEHDRDIRLLAKDLARQALPGEPVLMCHPKNTMLAELAWYLRTEVPALRWLPETSLKEESFQAGWLVLCHIQEPSVAEVLARMGSVKDGWRVSESDVRFVPPENGKMAPVFCRWVRVVAND